jgi:glutamate--cysteine ligase
MPFNDPKRLRGVRRGIEKESLRVRPDGRLADTPHPRALGSALTHPNITTDFSESQLELITGAHESADVTLEELERIHQVVYQALGNNEMLWCASMPCGLPADDAIPLGRYGSSNVGRSKTVYRSGLSYRYGRRMQMISGIHYNFSVPGTSTEDYFALIRNFRRISWLPLYLFGASPAVCESFVEGRPHELRELVPGTMYLPYATSLRMGRLGYQSDAQAALNVSYNSLESYAASLDAALTKPYPPYEKIGIRDEQGSYRQLATSLLQIENEFYSTIRPKRRIHPGERPLHALRERGVEYIEVRLMDLDPFSPVGITAPTMRVLDLLLLYCLHVQSPPDTPDEIAAVKRNQHRVAAGGREPGLRLERAGKEMALAEWGLEVLTACESIADTADRTLGGSAYQAALSEISRRMKDSALTPSARVLHAMERNHQGSYTRFVLAESLAHAGTLRNLPLSADVAHLFDGLAKKSLATQKRIESADTLDFETYRQKYLAHDTLIIRREQEG